MAGKIILANAVKREPGKMYYISGTGDVCEATMSHGKKKKKAKKTADKKIKK
jgi:hypothetical protein